jgi:hypothetical protein
MTHARGATAPIGNQWRRLGQGQDWAFGSERPMGLNDGALCRELTGGLALTPDLLVYTPDLLVFTPDRMVFTPAPTPGLQRRTHGAGLASHPCAGRCGLEPRFWRHMAREDSS